MEEAPGNPPTNQLGSGVTDEDVLKAIEASGYALQSVAVDRLLDTTKEILCAAELTSEADARLRIRCQEEWSYVDSDTEETRSLDALISIEITRKESIGKPVALTAADSLYMYLDLLIECKQSELPLVFFMRPVGFGNVPHVMGLPHEWLTIAEKGKDFSFNVRVYDVLGFRHLPLAKSPKTAISMSKAHRKGKVLELSGEDAFRALSLPLSKALRYYQGLTQPDKPNLYTHTRMVVPLAVVRAPMIAVDMDNGQPQLTATPWVRLVRVDPAADTSARNQFAQPVAIDVVHVDYLNSYAKVALESCIEGAQRIADFAIPCLSGTAMHCDDTEADGEEADDKHDSSTEKPWYLSMRPSMSEDDFMAGWKEWFRRAHS